MEKEDGTKDKVQREVVLPIEGAPKEKPQEEPKVEPKVEVGPKEEAKIAPKEGVKVETKEKPKEEPKKVYKMDLVKDLGAIFILGRGQSLGYCPKKYPPNTELWGCNNTYKAREVDRLFIMHDIYMTQFNRASKIIEEANQKGFPVYTLGKYKELENNIQYPMEEIIKYFGIAYFLNTISYMLALAIMQEPKNLFLFGVDMDFGTAAEYMQNEKSNLEYWLGQATGRKIQWKLSPNCTLMKRKGRDNFYGMKEIKDPNYNTLRLDPVWEWNKPKSALKYDVVKVAHNL